MKQTRMTVLAAILLALFLLAGCAHTKKSDYSAETVYRRDGYTSELSLRVFSAVQYPPTVEIFGMHLDGVEYSYTAIRPDGTIESLRYQQRSDLIHELEQDFRKALSEDRKKSFSEVELTAYLEFAEQTVLLFQGSASVSAASSRQYPCILVQCDPDLQVLALAEFTTEGALGAKSLAMYEGG